MSLLYISEDTDKLYRQYTANVLTNKDNLELFTNWHENNDTSAREKIIFGNIRLVYKALSKVYIMDAAYDMDDMLQQGLIALIKAVDTFDYHVTLAFSTYAVRCIQNEFGMIFRVTAKTNSNVSIEKFYMDEDSGEYTEESAEFISNYNLEDDVFLTMDLKLLDNFILTLPKDYQYLLILRYGLYGNRMHNHKELANLFNLSASGVNKRLMKIRSKLKEYYGL